MAQTQSLYPYLFVNGEIRLKEEAMIPIYDLGLLRGMGIFDFFRVWDGIPVFVEDHISRLQQSLDVIGIHVEYTTAEWLEKIREMIRINNCDNAGFRIVVTGGFSEDGYSVPEQPNVYMMLHYLPANDPKQWENGVSLITSNYQRDMPLAKTTIYVQSMKLQPAMKKAGAYEVLYHWNGKIRECSRCNIFFIDQDGVLHTPSNSMLRGITRKQVLAIAAEHGIRVEQREIDMAEVPQMAGAFLTATTKGVLPVVKIDDQIIGDGRVHPLAQKLNALFQDHFEKYIAAARLAQIVM